MFSPKTMRSTRKMIRRMPLRADKMLGKKEAAKSGAPAEIGLSDFASQGIS
jgi:hypothetical protein